MASINLRIDDDLELVAIVRERLASPEPSIPVSLDDL